MSAEPTPPKNDPAQTPPSDEEPPKRKRRGCLRKLCLIALIGTPILLLLINGLIFRWVATFGIKKGAESIGLTGEVTVNGTIISGFELVDVAFTGDGTGPVESLKIGNANVDYSILELIQTGGLTWLNKVNLSDAYVTLVLAETTPEKEELPEEPAPEEKVDDGEPSILWQLLETQYALENINVHVTQGDKTYQVGEFTLVIPEDGNGKLTIARLEIPGAKPRSAIETDIKVTPESLTLGPLAILDPVEVTALTVQQAPPTDPFLTAKLGLSGGSLEASYTAEGTISAGLVEGNISLPELLALAQIENLKSGSISKFNAQFTGDFAAPATWKSDVTIGLSSLQWDAYRADEISLVANLVPDDTDPEQVRLVVAHNGAKLDATASVALAEAESTEELASLPLDIDADLTVQSVENIIAEFLPDSAEKIPAKGALAAKVTAAIAEKTIQNAHVDIGSETLSYDAIAIDSLQLIADLTETKTLTVDADIAIDERRTTLEADATATLPENGLPEDLMTVPLTADATLNVGAVENIIANFLPQDSPSIPAKGSLKTILSVEIEDKKFLKADANISSRNLSYDGVDVDLLRLHSNLKEADTIGFDADLALDKNTYFGADGSLDPNSLAYSGKADLTAAVTGRLKTLLAKLGFEKELEAATTIQWEGEGNIKEKKHRGGTTVVANKVRFDGATPFSANLEGSYDNLDIDLTTLAVTSEILQFESPLAYHDAVLDLPQIQLRSGDLVLLEGHVKTPLDPEALKTPAGYFTQEGEVDIDITSHNLALESILGLIQQEPPVNCRIGLALKATGPPANLDLDGTFTANDISIPNNDIAPAQARIDVSIKDAVASLGGRVEQPQVQPLTLVGTMPFAPVAWVEGTRDPLEEAVSFNAKMEKSQLAFLAAYAPAINTIDGAVDIDVALSGTLNQPSLIGKADLRVDALSFASTKAPSIREFVTALRFEEQVLHIDELNAIVAGGRLGMGGSIGFPKKAHPELDIQLAGREVLIHRSDSLSARTNLDLSLKGPFPTAALSGTIGITSSLFYKDIDLLPIGGIGRGGGKSALPPVQSAPNMPLPKSLDVGVPLEPFKNWPVDVKIVTADPFRVAGNIARAEVLCDLSITGTLGTPIPNGKVWIPNGRVTLPFSKIDLAEAEVLFDEATGFNGNLGVRANSKVGDYRVSIFAHNRILDPKIVFTSIPPLPREDILTLIASGVTREQLTDGGGTAATKAFIYWLKSLSNKEGKIDPDAPPTFAETLEERTDVSFGAVDPDTGEMGITASIRLWRESYVAFSLGKQGSQRGVLKYIFRFR